MNLQKILTIAAAVIGVISIFFLIRIVGAGDEEIKAAAEAGDTSKISPIISIAYVIVGIALLLTLVFSLKNIFANKDSIKKTLGSLAVFALVALICYFALAKGVETPLRDGGVLTASQSQLVGAGLWMFYFLAAIAAGAMVFTGVKKMIK